MNDQFDVNGGVSEMAVSRQHLEHLEEDAEDEAACAAFTETIAHGRLAYSNETTEDQTGGNDARAIKESSLQVSEVGRVGGVGAFGGISTINTFPGCYDDDYYGSVQLI